MNKRDLLLLVLISAFVLGSRIACMESAPLLYDSGNFFLAADDYNISQDRPHLPGYFLHVQSIKFFRLFMEPMHANVAPSIVWQVLGCALLYMLARRYADERTSLFIALFVATNPFVWFFGCTSEVYSFDLFFSCMLIVLASKRQTLLVTPVLMAIALGVRQSSPILLLPLYFWLWISFTRHKAIPLQSIVLSHIAALIVLCLWLFPMIQSCGGIQEYLSLFHTHNPMMKSTIAQNITVMTSYAMYALPALAILYGYVFYTSGIAVVVRSFPDSRLLGSIGFWFLIPVAFFAIEFYGKGYFLLSFAALPLLVTHRVKTVPTFVLSGLITLQVLLFLFTPIITSTADIWVSSEHSHSTSVSKALLRVRSVYAPVFSEVQYLNSAHTFADSVLQNNNKRYILVDPTYPISSRALQARHPAQTFVTLLVRENGQLQFHHNRDIYIGGSLRNVLDSGIVLTTHDFTARYSNGLLKTIQQSQNLCACVALQSDSTSLLYKTLFVH